jgi:hypothetical protein
LHASKVFTTPITTFEETPNQQKIVVLIGLQIVNKVEPLEKASVEPIEGVINQLIAEDKS